MGARAYRCLSLYDPAPGCLIEVGSERGEGSTAWLNAYARRTGLVFYTADVDPDAHERAARITRNARLCTGTSLLRRLRRSVSVAYLDGFDWTPKGTEYDEWIIDQRQRYADLGFELTNAECQAVHLEEARLVAAKAADRCVVVCDDTWLDGGWTGKGGLAVPLLIGEGFRVVDHHGCEPDSLGFVVLRR